MAIWSAEIKELENIHGSLKNLRKDERFEKCIQKARDILESLKEL